MIYFVSMCCVAAAFAIGEVLRVIRRPAVGAVGMLFLLGACEALLATGAFAILSAVVRPDAWIAEFVPYVVAVVFASAILRGNVGLFQVGGKTKTYDILRPVNRQRRRWILSIDERTTAREIVWADKTLLPKIDHLSPVEVCHMASEFYGSVRRMKRKRKARVLKIIKRVRLDTRGDAFERRRVVVHLLLSERGRSLVMEWSKLPRPAQAVVPQTT